MFKDQGDVPFKDIRRELIFKWTEETNFEGMPCIHITEQQYEQLIPHVVVNAYSIRKETEDATLSEEL